MHRIGYLGNFRPEHSTENHVAAALRALGYTVEPYQEDEFEWGATPDVDLILWTRTWRADHDTQRRFLGRCRAAAIPTVAYHLDRWWGLDREHLVREEPFFGCDLVVTADGGHDRQWAEMGVNHVWMPPAVDWDEAFREPEYEDRFDVDVAFVGNLTSYGHPEWAAHRRSLFDFLTTRYAGRFRPYCCGFRGQDLANLYTTAKVIVGDSCLAGGATHYWSDRIPETLGRGGFLLHPEVVGLDEHFTPGEHLVTYPVGDWDQLGALIDHYIDNPVDRRRIARAGQAHVRACHTYRHRMAAVMDLAGALDGLEGHQGVVTVASAGMTAKFDLRPAEGHRAADGGVVREVWRDHVYPLTPGEVSGRVVLDVGANVGAFAIWAALAGAAKVYAYEPDPGNLAALNRNVALNGLGDRIVALAEGVGGVTGDRWLGGDGANAHMIDAPASLTDDVPVVTVRAIDDVLEHAGENLIVKMDCEGCEHEVIEHVTAGHLRRVDRIVMEYHDGPFGDGWRAHPEGFGRLVRRLAEEGMVTTVGRPSTGLVNIDWRRYGT